MKKVLIGLVLALGLAGCNINLNPNVATPQDVVIAANAFDAAEATAANYLTLPLCGSVAKVCRTQASDPGRHGTVRAGRAARDQLLADINSSTPIPVTLLQALTTTVSTLQSLNVTQ